MEVVVSTLLDFRGGHLGIVGGGGLGGRGEMGDGVTGVTSMSMTTFLAPDARNLTFLSMNWECEGGGSGIS